jgi:hypothetical protein
MLLVAPVVVRAPLEGIAGTLILEGFTAPVFNIGDGIQLEVFVLESGHERRVYDRYFDPGRRAGDRAWIPFSIPFDLGNSGGGSLEIRISAGPQGDLTADWLAIGSLRLVQEGARQ